MNLLLDTRILIWALINSPKLTVSAKNLLSDTNNNLFFSPISIWEIETKKKFHNDEFDFSTRDIYDFSISAGYKQVIFKADDVFILSELKRKENSSKHKDPFDQMLLCQAKSENLQLITHDSKLTEYNFDNVILI